jgi:hypothetical protein
MMMRLWTTRALAVVVAIATPAVGIALAAAPASAATTTCGSNCTSFYPLSTGTSDVLAVENPSGTSAHTGQAVTIAAASSTNQGEDWVLEIQGTVDDFVAAGLMSEAMALHYGNDEVYEIDYAPDFTWTGECLGVSSSTGSGSVSLQGCGNTAATLWVADTADQNGRALPLINGNNSNFSHPYALKAGSPGAQLSTSGLEAPIPSTQEWGTIFGVL